MSCFSRVEFSEEIMKAYVNEHAEKGRPRRTWNAFSAEKLLLCISEAHFLQSTGKYKTRTDQTPVEAKDNWKTKCMGLVATTLVGPPRCRHHSRLRNLGPVCNRKGLHGPILCRWAFFSTAKQKLIGRPLNVDSSRAFTFSCFLNSFLAMKFTSLITSNEGFKNNP